jgi:NADH-quinone oxidoreductase subunit N
MLVGGLAGAALLGAVDETRRRGRWLLVAGALASLAGALLGLVQFRGAVDLFNGGLVLDGYSGFVSLIVMACGAGVLLISLDSHEVGDEHRAEYVSLVLFAVLGAVLAAATKDFVSLFLALQLASIPLYILSGFMVADRMATEAAFKYMLLGMVASVVMLYGFSIDFAHNATTELAGLGGAGGPAAGAATAVGLVFILVGCGFKAGAAPMHFWIPDTYQGAAIPVTALLATVPKCAIIAVLMRLSLTTLMAPGLEWSRWLLAAMAVASMTLGNLIALSQTDLKRLLAYSSIAHVGYVLAAPAIGAGARGAEAALFYAAVYAITNLGAFAVVLAVAGRGRSVEVDSLSGLLKRSPLAAGALAFFVLSMLGLPPTPGFWAKFGLVSLCIGEGWSWMAAVIVVNSLVSVVYYIRIVRPIFMTESASVEPDAAGGELAAGGAEAAEAGLPGRAAGSAAPGAATRTVILATTAIAAAVGLWPAGLGSMVATAVRAVAGG